MDRNRARHLAALGAVLALAALAAAAPQAQSPPASLDATPSLDVIIDRAIKQRWNKLAIGQRNAMFGLAFQGAPYLAGTLEGPGDERCRITTEGFDCVTFVELSLNLARVVGPNLGKAFPTEDDIRKAVELTRYRGGYVEGYESRLHYTAEWIADNVAKGVVKDVTPSLGGVRYPVAVSFMSSNPDSYAVLRGNPEMVDSIRAIEGRVSAVRRTYVPKSQVEKIEEQLKTGDIVAITTSIKGLDYAHAGVIVRDASGDARFLHASSTKGRVALDAPIVEYLASGPKHHTGITVVRPVEPRATQ